MMGIIVIMTDKTCLVLAEQILLKKILAPSTFVKKNASPILLIDISRLFLSLYQFIFLS